MSKPIICLSTQKEKSTASATSILLTIHWVGGNANVYRFLGKELEDLPVEVYGINLPYRYANEKKTNALKSLPEIIRFFEENIISKATEWNPRMLPIILLGHSFGGTLSFELLRSLQESNQRKGNSSAFEHFFVKKVIISASLPPHYLNIRNKALMNNHLNNKRAANDEIPCHLKKDAELIRYVVDNDGLPANVAIELLNFALPVIRNDYYLFENYRYVGATCNNNEISEPQQEEAAHERAYLLDLPVSVIIPSNDKTMDSESMTINDMVNWLDYSIKKDEFTIHQIDKARHFYLINEEFQSGFIEIIRKELH
jgi:surfactin synthase thioesterase subunit